MGLAAVLSNGLVIFGFIFTGKTELIMSLIAGAILPILISAILLVWAGGNKKYGAQQLQKINIIGFFFKVILLGVWAVILINSGTLDMVTFVVILLINFLAWHGVEAYYWPLFMASNAQREGENP